MAAPKILLVDDEGLMLALYKTHIERAGYQLITAKSGEEAIELAARETPNLIVMDVVLQGINGLTALRTLKTSDVTKAIPVMIITASVSQQYEAARRESELAGAVRFLTKPISPSQLLAEIRQVVPNPPRETLDPGK